MGFEDMLEPIKDMIEDGVKKLFRKIKKKLSGILPMRLTQNSSRKILKIPRKKKGKEKRGKIKKRLKNCYNFRTNRNYGSLFL